MPSDIDRDPERDRIDELLDRVREGTASDADREELTLYGEDRPDLAIEIERAEQERQLGGEWLARSAADRRNEAAHDSPLARAERALGSTLAIGGTIGALFSPALGLAALAGLGLLGFSALRVHVKTSTKDPYKGVKQ
jgi:ferric-dicitrate binding protein FerR (iron transport regulator)